MNVAGYPSLLCSLPRGFLVMNLPTTNHMYERR